MTAAAQRKPVDALYERVKGINFKQIRTDAEGELCRQDLRWFIKCAWRAVEPKRYTPNWHIDAIADHLAWVSLGEIRNLIINIPPRMTKSLSTSVCWPVWDWLVTPSSQFLCASYAHDLAIRDAVKSRRLIESAWFQDRYMIDFSMNAGDNNKHRYSNDKGGYRISTSVGGKTTGEGGDKIVIDDPHNMKDVYSDVKRHATLAWWDNSMRSRLNDPTTGQKVINGQRSHDNDLFGHLLETEGDRWVHLNLPMEFDPPRKCITYPNPKGLRVEQKERAEVYEPLFEDPREKRGDLLNPLRFGEEEVLAERHAMSERDYASQFQQDPSSGGGLIFKRQWWRQWCYPADHPQAGKEIPMPEFFSVVSAYDTAFEIKQENDCSARLTFGLFNYQDKPTGPPEVHAMLLERFNERVEFPELKAEARAHEISMHPEITMIEKKASGHSLIQEMARADIHVRAINPGMNDKVFRANMVQQILKNGRIWYVPRAWAYEVISQCAKFPTAEHDDMVDCFVMILAYMRRLGIVGVDDDEKPDEMNLFTTPKRFYG